MTLPPESCCEKVTREMTKLLNDHIDDEREQYDQLIVKINANDERSDSRHDETQRRLDHLLQSIEAFMSGNNEFMAAIKRAFPKDDEGRPDYDGHRTAHLSWITNAKDEKEVMAFVRKQMKDEEKSEDIVTYTKKVIFAGATLAVVSFVAVAAWAAFLKGPIT